MNLNPRQRRILEAIADHGRRCGRPPTRRELAAAVGLRSVGALAYQLDKLVALALVRVTASASRGLELTAAGKASIDAEASSGLPLLGRVPAGQPLEAVELAEEQPGSLRALFPKADYLLRVQGESLRDAGIRDGDLIAVRRIETARHGEIVVARLNGEDTVKRLYHRDGRLLLVPENSAMAPIAVDPDRDEFAIDGLVVGVIRPSLAR